MRPTLSVLAVVLASLAYSAEGQDHDDHLSEVSGVRILHAWTVETRESSAPVYLDIENTGATDITLMGGETTAGAEVSLVGLNYSAEGATPEPIGAFPIPAGSELALTPEGLYLLISDLNGPLSEGDEFDLHVVLDPIGEIEVHVDVEAEGTTQHPHAGHNH